MIAWTPKAAVSAWAANQYTDAITRYGDVSTLAPRPPNDARIATCPGTP